MADEQSGYTISLTADAEHRMQPGDEVAVQLPVAAPEAGWTYEIEGDGRALDVYERAEVVTAGGEHVHPPGAAGASLFLIRAARKGKAQVRFEQVDPTAQVGPLRLRVKVG